MPNLKTLIEQGTTFENAFVSNSLCCPSRATILRGQYTHNHEILSNEPPLGGFAKFRFLGHEDSTMATWLQERGYRTAFFGKYMNGYSDTHVPPGWDEWYGVAGNYLSHMLNENGHIVNYDPETDYDTDILSDKASDYVERTAGADPPFFTTDRSFLMWIGTKAPHQPATPAPRHEDDLKEVPLPRPPSFDEKDISDKPRWVGDNPPLSAEQKQYMEELHRKRLQSMLAVDDMIGDLVDSLRKSNELDDTYIFFTSDNGFHLGEHRLGSGKWTAYEEDIRVPLVVRGPAYPKGRRSRTLVLNNDLGAHLRGACGGEDPVVCGRALACAAAGRGAHAPEDWRQAFVVEAIAERGGSRPPFINESRVAPLLTGDPLPKYWRRSSAATAELNEGWGRPWLKALRTKNYLYVDYKSGEHEMYDLRRTRTSCTTSTAPPPRSSERDSRRSWMRCASAKARSAASLRTANR
jgi:arylsulfatase A-like enzyme